MDDLVAHADDVGPGDFRVVVRELAGYLAPGFTDDLDEMNQRKAEILVRVMRITREALVLPTAFFAMSSICPT